MTTGWLIEYRTAIKDRDQVDPLSPPVTRRCPHCLRPALSNAPGVTCGASDCQQAEYHANKLRNAPRKRSRRAVTAPPDHRERFGTD